MQNIQDRVSLLFETSWEVCNKIGGIYTVLSTKAACLGNRFGDRLLFIGPDVWTADNPSPSFKERRTLLGNASGLELPHGIRIRVGRWNVPGSPIAVLVDFHPLMGNMNAIFGEMWERYGVDSLHSYGDYEEGCAFAVAAAIVIEALTAHLKADPRRVIAHFDEWTTGMGLLYLKARQPGTATLFTTHATSIGRSICSNGKPLYDYFRGYDGDQMARELNMESKHSLEKNAARQADCFTTVSEVTAAECRQLLRTDPQVVTPNGFEPAFAAKGIKWTRRRNRGRKRLLEVADALTGHSFVDADTFIVATSGRNEYRNKGLDLYIDSLDRLAADLPGEGKEILAFIFVPAWVKGPNARLKGGEGPDFMTHRLNNEESDPVALRLARRGANGSGARVTLIYVPCYLDGNDGVIDISYYDLLPALDLTVFPSYYEPWGYTPLESIATGIPAISTDKAGFGRWILGNFDNTFAGCGARVITRTDSGYDESCRQLAGEIASAASFTPAEWKRASEAARATAAEADWNIFIKYYDKAFEVALRRRDERLAGNNS